ncbi:MAG: hypothetical protein ACYTGS_15870 [Planctomycetota bacterium]|jgi:hypothetical protein
MIKIYQSNKLKRVYDNISYFNIKSTDTIEYKFICILNIDYPDIILLTDINEKSFNELISYFKYHTKETEKLIIDNLLIIPIDKKLPIEFIYNLYKLDKANRINQLKNYQIDYSNFKAKQIELTI